MITNKKLMMKELIGSVIEITESRNHFNEGIKGKIIDETKNSFIIESEGIRKRLIKKDIIFKVKVKNQIFQIKGGELIGRPEEMLKK